jgi:TM2 domain-containing membrane protein YozV
MPTAPAPCTPSTSGFIARVGFPLNHGDSAMADEMNASPDRTPTGAPESKRTVAGILGILIGWTGAHKFMVGNTKAGVMQIASNILCGAGAIIGLIEGIMYLMKTDAEFVETYQVGKKDWF